MKWTIYTLSILIAVIIFLFLLGQYLSSSAGNSKTAGSLSIPKTTSNTPQLQPTSSPLALLSELTSSSQSGARGSITLKSQGTPFQATLWVNKYGTYTTIGQLTSKSDGTFSVQLPPGEYEFIPLINLEKVPPYAPLGQKVIVQSNQITTIPEFQYHL